MEKNELLLMNELENAIDSLKIATQEILTSEQFRWKWITIALHHSLYSFCVACQSQGNPDNVISIGEDDKYEYVMMGNETKYSHPVKEFIGRTPAYRIRWELTDYSNTNQPPASSKKVRKTNKLISFWTALARVQDPYFWMGKLTCLRPLILDDEQIKLIVYFTRLRNELVHFKPKSFGLSVSEIKTAALVILDSIEFLALKSNAITKYHGLLTMASSGLENTWREFLEFCGL